MRAIVVREPGETGRLELTDVPDPEPGPADAVVRVGAAGVNNADLMLRRGFFGTGAQIPGIDVAGTIVSGGRDVAQSLIGTRVVLNPAVTCGVCEYCRAGEHGTCRSRQALGQQRDGGYAEYVRIPIDNIHPIADALTLEQAAAIPSNFFTAWQMLMSRGRLTPGETVLITAAAGGVGSAAIQIARLAGARVIAAVGREDKRAFVLSLGADETINHTDEDLGERVLALTHGRGAELVLDIVGASNWPHYLRAVRAGGRIVVCSVTGGRNADLDLVPLLANQITIVGTGGIGSKSIAARVVALFNESRLAPQIDRVLPLADAEQAHAVIAGRDVMGKIVLKP
jgi:NADPH:quinone reductase-like Zn-dependent oxidoreductase